MWRTEIVNSSKQYMLSSLFYTLFIIILISLLNGTYFDDFIFVAVIMLVIEWWRSCCYFMTIRGELAVFYTSNEIYWSRQRWFMVRKPIYFRYGMIIPLQSKRRGNKRVLFLMSDSFNNQDWRSINYFIRQLVEFNQSKH